ncbi:TerB family tellurite resistance protein [Joostella sp. CR20]|uniref:TerB family tellurite resistance protein n=1 Tax=Joostella sp. CR20 TaxID=2804312 RepID=UPI00313D7022
MNEKNQKLSLLAEMIALVNADKVVHEQEYAFIKTIATHLGVSETELETLFNNTSTPYVPPVPESQRILQFHRLVLLMNIDQENHPEEIQRLKEFGLRMGLSPFATNQVLKVMNNYPNKVIPPEVLIDIFKTHYN